MAFSGVGHLSAQDPILNDSRLKLSLFAEQPDIVTPIGLAIDREDRIFVLESHTHTPPKDYQGPKSDRIKLFIDADNDGKPDGPPHIFAEGIQAGMNLAFSRGNTLYACAAWEVIAFPDKYGDLKADENKVILRLETQNTYPHSAQMGIVISGDDWIYITRGNNGGRAWTLHGTDGRSIQGFGDGGNVVRCKLDGSQVEEVATGFWNSMNLKFDSQGRLLVVDNDPDARGPNRLVHIVEQGDYGYKSVYGGGGNHPYQGWDGTLPGTLGYAAGLGEAPCDLIAADQTGFSDDYQGDLLVTIWNENKITRLTPTSHGVSIKAEGRNWMEGDENFRPVALDADSRGNLFITDWVKVDYPNHGHGRIWRVTPKEKGGMKPRNRFEFMGPSPGAAGFAKLITASSVNDLPWMREGLIHDEPFMRHAATLALSRPIFRDKLGGLARDANSRVRLGSLLAMRRSGLPDWDSYIEDFLSDSNEDMIIAALMWIGEEGKTDFKEKIDQILKVPDLSARVFETYLATLETLDPDFIEAFRSREGRAGQLRRRLDPEVLRGIIENKDNPDRVRALAVIHLENPGFPENLSLLEKSVVSGGPRLKTEAIRSLSETSADVTDLFIRLAHAQGLPVAIRAEALLGLAKVMTSNPERLLDLLHSEEVVIRLETLRTLRQHAYHPDIRPVLESLYKNKRAAGMRDAEFESLEYALFPPGVEHDREIPRPVTLEQWQATLKQGGDPESGELIFFSSQTQCSACHLMQNRGRRIGPELSNLGQSVSREQIIQSIIQPSDQYPPEFQAWFVALKNGEIYQGLQLDHKSGGAIELFTTEGVTRKFKADDIENYGVLPQSLMPDGLEQAMTVEEMRDLVAFLESLKD